MRTACFSVLSASALLLHRDDVPSWACPNTAAAKAASQDWLVSGDAAEDLADGKAIEAAVATEQQGVLADAKAWAAGAVKDVAAAQKHLAQAASFQKQAAADKSDAELKKVGDEIGQAEQEQEEAATLAKKANAATKAEKAEAAQELADAKKLEEAAAAEKAGVVAMDIPALLQAEKATETQDTFVAFYAPWCGHCQTFVLQQNGGLNQLATALSSAKNLRVAKFDVDAEEIPSEHGYAVQYIPTSYMICPGGKKTKYSGGMDQASLVSFVKANSCKASVP
eukprot:CAMPEP_0204386008 /NCGR_PEP_ID=MMETSP0469-20131031/58102_1 /ASSEMBLY_ACC=CAM_ASM_000384 /TAXON_ID=2969 /ORGANISM="Oxyrrhis marina" /LENGTH=280 /DNA_ID=CAMNT_0051379131 /DNA_START=44 /DNA_END=886 /DNA_ORIENTATION=+